MWYVYSEVKVNEVSSFEVRSKLNLLFGRLAKHGPVLPLAKQMIEVPIYVLFNNQKPLTCSIPPSLCTLIPYQDD